MTAKKKTENMIPECNGNDKGNESSSDSDDETIQSPRKKAKVNLLKESGSDSDNDNDEFGSSPRKKPKVTVISDDS